MARIAERGLRRSVGVPGLFATAYGNVGSSIYYAVGLVALHALGPTPVVFMLAGGLFAHAYRANDDDPPASGYIDAPSAYVFAVRANSPPASMKTTGVRPSAWSATRPSA